MADTTIPASPDFLISSADYLNAHPGFTLVGRREELDAAADVLKRKPPQNNLILAGRPGTGLSSLVMGMQVADAETGAPALLADNSVFYLDVNALFAQGDPNKVRDGFQKALDTLQGRPHPVLIVEKTNDFLKGVSDNGANDLVFSLMKQLESNPELQTIFMVEEGKQSSLLDMNDDLKSNFIQQTVGEPSKDDLRPIVKHAAAKLAEAYDVTLAKEAIDSVLELTSKYAVEGQPQQPTYALNILKGAIMAAKRTAQAETGAALEKKLAALDEALAQGKPADGELAGKSPAELEAIRTITKNEIAAAAQKQEEIAQARREMDAADASIREIRGQMGLQAEQDIAAAAEDKRLREEVLAQYNAAAAAGDVKRQAALEVEYLKRSNSKRPLTAGAPSMENGDIPDTDSPAYAALEEKLERKQAIFDKHKAAYDALTAAEPDEAGNDNAAPVTLTDDDVLGEFSRLSRVPMTKLREDESQKLMDLEKNLGERVVGQQQAIREVAKSVRRARAGLKEPNLPDGVFLFLGPPGVGKTELCKALSDHLGYALNFIDMTQYSEKHAVSGLIGAAPGLVGHDKEGELTRKVRANPKCIVCLDEAEKAHPDVYDVLLHPFNEGVIPDNKGNDVSLNNALFILTSNLGTEYFMEEGVSYQEAAQKAEAAARAFFKTEFIRRLDGIVCFNKLEDGQIEIIAVKSLNKLNGWLAAQGKDLKVEMAEADLKKMCAEKNDQRTGASSIMKYIQKTITSVAADEIIENPGSRGTMKVHYTPTAKMSAEDIAAGKSNIIVDPPAVKEAAPKAAAKQNAAPAQPAVR